MTKPFCVVHVNTKGRSGGAAQMARRLSAGLNESGLVHSALATGRDCAEDDIAISNGIEVLGAVVACRLLGVEGNGNWLGITKMLKATKRADVMHYHNLHGYYVNVPSLIAASRGKPLVWTLHDMWPITGRCAYAGTCGKWQTGCGDCPDLKRYPATLTDRSRGMWLRKSQWWGALDPRSTVVVTPSKWLQRHLDGSMLSTFRSEVIPNAVDEVFFRAGVSGQKSRNSVMRGELGSAIRCLVVASEVCDPRKGVIPFLREVMESKLPISVCVVGGRAGCLKPFRNVGRVSVLGQVGSRIELARLYRENHLTVVPSLDDNLPTTVYESMACGTPVVAFSTGGIPEQIGLGGVTVRTGDFKALINEIDVLRKDESRLVVLGEEARKQAARQCSTDRFVQRYLALYETLLGRRRAT